MKIMAPNFPSSAVSDGWIGLDIGPDSINGVEVEWEGHIGRSGYSIFEQVGKAAHVSEIFTGIRSPGYFPNAGKCCYGHLEEVEKKGGGNWQSSDTRELLYSFHRDHSCISVWCTSYLKISRLHAAGAVMHKCVVHFIPKK
ncbi:phosphoglycerate kinase family protein, partial [Striga asiatica]